MSQQTKTTELTMTVLMTPEMANFSGNVHGGTILKFLDEVAFACASRYSGSYVVTVSVGLVEFKEPIHVGELVSFVARIDSAGRSSMVISVEVIAENIRDRNRRNTNHCYFTMVAMEDGKPKAIPPYVPETEDEKQRDHAAKIRRRGMVDPDAAIFEDLIDAIHTAMLIYDEDGAGACDVFLQNRGLKRDTTFKVGLQALINAIPRTKIKDQFVRPEADVLDRMRLAFYADELTVPPEEVPPIPQALQLGLFDEK